MLLVKSRPTSGFELMPGAYDLHTLALHHAEFMNVRLKPESDITIGIIKRKIALYNGYFKENGYTL